MGGGIKKLKAKKKSKRKAGKSGINRILLINLCQLKGERFTGLFRCDVCGHTKMSGFFYEFEGKEYEACKDCINSMKDKRENNSIWAINTPMGNKR